MKQLTIISLFILLIVSASARADIIINIDSPENTSYNETILWLNWSTINSSELKYAAYKLNDNANITLIDNVFSFSNELISGTSYTGTWPDAFANTYDGSWVTYGASDSGTGYINYSLNDSTKTYYWHVHGTTFGSIVYYCKNESGAWVQIGTNTADYLNLTTGLCYTGNSILETRIDLSVSGPRPYFYEGEILYYDEYEIYNTTFSPIPDYMNNITVWANTTGGESNYSTVWFLTYTYTPTPIINITIPNYTISIDYEPSLYNEIYRAECVGPNELRIMTKTQECLSNSGNESNCIWFNRTIIKYCVNGCYDNVTEYGSACAPVEYMIYVYGMIIFIVSIIIISYLFKGGRRR